MPLRELILVEGSAKLPGEKKKLPLRKCLLTAAQK